MRIDRRRRCHGFVFLVACTVFEAQCCFDLDHQYGSYITPYSDIAIMPKRAEHDFVCVVPAPEWRLQLAACNYLLTYGVYMLPERKILPHTVEGVIRSQYDDTCWTLSGNLSGDAIKMETCGHFRNQTWRIFCNHIIWNDELNLTVTVRGDNHLVAVKRSSPEKFLVFQFAFLSAYSRRILGGGKSELYISAVGFTLCHLTFILYAFTSFRQFMSLINSLRSWTTRHLRALSWQRCKLPHDDPRSKKARELAGRMRLAHAHSGLGAIMNFGLAPLLLVQMFRPWAIHFGLMRQSGHWDAVQLYCHEFLLVVILSPVVVLFCRYEHFRSGRTLDFFWVLGSAVWIFKYRISVNHCFRFNDVLITQCRLFFSIILGNAKLATFLETIVTVAQVWIYAQNSIEQLNPGNMSKPALDEFWYLFRSVANLILSLTFVWVIELATFRQAQATVEARESNQDVMVATKLLGCMCDTVVHLGTDLQIAKPTPKLAAMLQRQVDTVAPLLGVKIQDFMDHESMTRYEDYMEEQMKHAEESHAPRPLNVNLYDSNRIQVSAEIVCACIPDSSSNFGDYSIVIGISEVNERQAESIDALPQLNMQHQEKWRDDASSSSGSSVSEDMRLENRGDMSFEVDIDKEEIRSASESFTEFVGPFRESNSLRDILIEPHAFIATIYDALDDAWFEKKGRVLPITFEMSVMRSWISSCGNRKRRRITFNACAQVTIPCALRKDDALIVLLTSLRRKTKQCLHRGTPHATTHDSFAPVVVSNRQIFGRSSL